MNYRYPKAEKLCSKVIIDKIFEEQKPIYEYPLKVLWIIEPLPQDVFVQSAVTVSKRRFKLAVHRNLIKRRLREAFRLNKHDLYITAESKKLQLAVIFIYNHSKILPFSSIEPAMIKALDKIVQKVSTSS